MLEDILPAEIAHSLNMLNYKSLCEIRLRVLKPITVNYANSYYFLGQAGLCKEQNAFVCTKQTIQSVINKASNFSIYAINDEIKNGYISVKGGIRIGVTGEVVMENDKILTTKNISSINIRIPHQIIGCSYKIAKLIFDENTVPQSTLILGSPCTGKTTILRDLCYQINAIKKELNILLLDERMEISASCNGVPELNVGTSTDVISGGKKNINIANGIRSMAPNIVVVDEIGNLQDVEAVECAVNMGVCVLASVHSKNIFELQRKKQFENMLKTKAFKRFVELSNSNGKGTIENIYDENFRSILRPV